MGHRVGVDVGGTFTKAVAIDGTTHSVAATSVVPTTHTAAEGVAAGVVAAVRELADQLGPESIELVTHSTTEAVNALLEGDVGTVGIIGLGRRPDLRAVEKRTRLADVEVSAGKHLPVTSHFFDVTDGLPVVAIQETLRSMQSDGVAAVCVAEAFSPDDTTNETAVVELAHEMGLPVCASTDLSGLYGLELRTVTAAINASILPIAIRTASFVEAGVRAAAITAPVMVMRSDGGATDLAGFRAAPVRTLYSGPAASVAGALRYTGVTEGVVVEVGGTSTNIAGITGGRPHLSYVRVATHATALRSVDVRVLGVAGGSMLRARRGRVHGVGPRSAHIAGLAYACFTDPDALVGATVELIAPRQGDPDDYVTLALRSGARVAVTNTCAANALGVTEPGDYCHTSPEAAHRAFEILAGSLRPGADTIAQQMLTASGEAVCELALRIAKDSELAAPELVGVGGGAGGLARIAARMLGWPITVPDRAEVISSVGDALSLLRAERERTTTDPGAIEEMIEAVEREVLDAGATASEIEVRVEDVPERGTVRAIATGAVGLHAGAVPGRSALDADAVAALGTDRNETVVAAGTYWLLGRDDHVRVLDQFGEPVASVIGELADEDRLDEVITARTRYRGPVTLRPTVWIIDGRRLLELNAFTTEENPYRGRPDVTYVVGRSG
jgi:N-methylhydantoinase A